MKDQKRETNGHYAFDGNLQRLCVCGHTLAHHSAGSPADCLYYSLSEREKQELAAKGEPGHDHVDCGCVKFRLSRKNLRS